MRRVLLRALLLALFAAAMWFAWLGWDHSYYYVDGVAQGPYRAWQVIGCGGLISAATVFAYLRTQGPVAIPVLAAAPGIGFAVPWAIDASSDETGTWLVGLFFLLVGSFVGLVVLLAVTEVVATVTHGRGRRGPMAEAIQGGTAPSGGMSRSRRRRSLLRR